MKAMILAAGYGERMLPITSVVPKPLIPVLGRPLAPQILLRLAAEGIDEAVINLHHLPQRMRDAFGESAAYGLRALYYSLEEEKLLGHWRRIGNQDLQDQLLEVIELSASGGRRGRA